MTSTSYAPFTGPITLASLDALFAHQTARFGGWRMAEGEDDWATVFKDQTPAQVKTALEEAQKAAKTGPDPWTETFKDQKPEDVKKALEESRKWETRAKGNKDKADQFDALSKLVTGNDDAGAPDPQKLATDLTAAQQQARAIQVENAVLKAAVTAGAHPVRLTDSRSFMDKALGLDPASADFTTSLDAAIKTAVDADTSLKVVAGPRPARQQGNPSEGQQARGGAELFALMHPAPASS